MTIMVGLIRVDRIPERRPFCLCDEYADGFARVANWIGTNFDILKCDTLSPYAQ